MNDKINESVFNPLKITDDYAEMKKIGRQIFQERPEKYSDKVIRVIRNNIDKFMADASAEEKESMFYRSIYDYWVYGSTISENLYYRFAEKSHEEKSKYLTAQNIILICNHLNDREESSNLLKNKCNAYEFLKEYYRRDAVLVHSEDDYEKFCDFVEKNPVFAVKPVSFFGGTGIYKDSVENYESPRKLFDKLLNERKLLRDNKSRDILLNVKEDVDIWLEGIIKQTPEMAKFHPGSVNFVRVATVRVGDDVKIFYPWFAVGAHGNFSNNSNTGGYSALINLETGIVETKLINKLDTVVEMFECHPETGEKVIGFQIPQWEELISMTKEMARKFKKVNYIGWDMAFTAEGWCVIEGNSRPGTAAPQVFFERGLKPELEKIIGWETPKKFWWEK